MFSVNFRELAKPKARAARTNSTADVPKIVQSHSSRSSASGITMPKVARIIRKQATAQEKSVSCGRNGGG